jgi:trans-feruloyl-CoA hydratase/vanillin synthase
MATVQSEVRPSDGRHHGMKQFLDDKSFKPGLGEYDKSKSAR